MLNLLGMILMQDSWSLGYLYINMIFTSFVFHTKMWKRNRERKAYLLYHEVFILEKIRYCA